MSPLSPGVALTMVTMGHTGHQVIMGRAWYPDNTVTTAMTTNTLSEARAPGAKWQIFSAAEDS